MVDMLEGRLILYLWGGNHVVVLGWDDVFNTRQVFLVIVIQALLSSKISWSFVLVRLAILDNIG